MDNSVLSPCVIGDETKTYRPVLPPQMSTLPQELLTKEVYLTALWRAYCSKRFIYTDKQLGIEWQGGQNSIPWPRMDEDGRLQRFALIERKRLPATVVSLRAPWDWTDLEAQAWRGHIWQGQCGGLPPDEVFQFYQPRPGKYESQLRTAIHPEAQLHYPPESLQFLLKQEARLSIQPPGPRLDELPTFKPSEVYQPLTAAQINRFETQLPEDDICLTLLQLLIDFESVGPYQVIHCNICVWIAEDFADSLQP